ncbi:MAG: hypothetical protein ABIJ21_06990 [Nanoarchaeota archaeon]
MNPAYLLAFMTVGIFNSPAPQATYVPISPTYAEKSMFIAEKKERLQFRILQDLPEISLIPHVHLNLEKRTFMLSKLKGKIRGNGIDFYVASFTVHLGEDNWRIAYRF